MFLCTAGMIAHQPVTTEKLYRFRYPDAERLNRDILHDFFSRQGDPETRRTHFFKGRYENLYLSREQVPGLQDVAMFAQSCAGDVLGRPSAGLRVGFWFNEMRPGDVTVPHRHDDDDELLSGAYYLQVPGGSGDFAYRDGDEVRLLSPRAGMLLLFRPDLEHWVTENHSGETRVSIGMNIGPPG